MHSDPTKDHQPRGKLEKLADLAFGTDAQIQAMPPETLDSRLAELGVSTEMGWSSLQRTLKAAEGKTRLAEGRARRLARLAGAAASSAIEETRDALVEQIRGMLALSEGSAVYARKWENSSLEDLRSLRDALAQTAARAARKKQNEQKP